VRWTSTISHVLQARTRCCSCLPCKPTPLLTVYMASFIDDLQHCADCDVTSMYVLPQPAIQYALRLFNILHHPSLHIHALATSILGAAFGCRMLTCWWLLVPTTWRLPGSGSCRDRCADAPRALTCHLNPAANSTNKHRLSKCIYHALPVMLDVAVGLPCEQGCQYWLPQSEVSTCWWWCWWTELRCSRCNSAAISWAGL
jgi:hypothetical protein